MIWLNGELRTADNAFSANDRGLLLGEAVFETLLVKQHIPQFWDAHLARLEAACAAFELPALYQASALKSGFQALLSANKSAEIATRAILRLTVTGGNGGRGLVANEDAKSNWLMQLTPAPAAPQMQTLMVCDVTRLAGGAQAAHKTTAYLDNILARRQALRAGFDEAVLLNQHGRIASAAAGTFYIQNGKQLITPPLSEGALPGILRAALLAHKHIGGLDICEGLIDRDMAEKADALFISNSVMEILPASFGRPVHDAQKKQGHALCEALPQFNMI